MPFKHPQGHRWHIFSQLVFRTYGDVCIVCQHGGARQVDHLISVTERPDLCWDLSNCRPIHGSPGNKCPVCFLNCNGIKGMGSVERARRIIAERIAEHAGKKPPPRVRDAPGRAW